MSTTYVLRNTVSDLGGGADFSNVIRQGVAIFGTQNVFVVANTTEDSYGFTQPGDPSTAGTTGVYSVNIDIVTGNNQIQASVSLQRIDSTGAVQSTSAFSLEQTATAGVKTFNFPATNLGVWASGDRLRVTYRFRNQNNMLQSISIHTNTSGATVIVPWTVQVLGDDTLLLDICGLDITHIHKWQDTCTLICDAQINAVDETAAGLIFYGLLKYERGYNANDKVFYMYTPRPPTQGPATYKFGTMNPVDCTHVQLQQFTKQWLQNLYWGEFFGVDRSDNMHYLNSSDNPTPNSRRYVKMDSTGAILVDVASISPAFLSPYGACWLSTDGTKIYGLGIQYEDNTTNFPHYIVWTVDTSSGVFSTVGARPVPPVLPSPVNTSILGNQILKYPDDSVLVFEGINKALGNSYIACSRYTNNGVFIETFNISTGLTTAIEGMPGGNPICSVAAAVTSDHSLVYLRLNYNSDTDTATNGRNKLFRTAYPLTAGSVFTFICDLYAVGQTICHWGQLQINTGDNILTGGLYAQIADVSTLSATLTAGPPTRHRQPFVTLIGAN